MKRRQFISGLMGLTAAGIVGNHGFMREQHWAQLPQAEEWLDNDAFAAANPYIDPSVDREQPVRVELSDSPLDDRDAHTMAVSQTAKEAAIKSAQTKVTKQVNKSIDFARDYDDDIFVSPEQKPILLSVTKRLQRIQKTIGFGHFNLVTFDEALGFAQRYAEIGSFTSKELDFIEQIFFTDASVYGFYGEKVTDGLVDPFKKSDAVKIPRSGHYILKHDSLAYYEKLKRDVGDSIILTSGIRANVKQLSLFLAKAVSVDGNLSRASRSLAPPGYSYHGIGDFDVGRVGWGAKNFTDDFALTDEFKKMQDLGYIAIRYDHGNQLGVRFEPWHIKVV